MHTEDIPIVYIAGPYSADNVIDVLSNIGRGIELSTKVFNSGFAPICPWFDAIYAMQCRGTLTVDHYKTIGLVYLRVSNALLLVPGWEHSHGTLEEIKMAWGLGMPVFTCISALRHWKRGCDERIYYQFMVTPENIEEVHGVSNIS